MATTPPKLLRVLVDYYQGGAKIYAAGNVYPESETLLLMKARGEAGVPKSQAESKAAKAAREAAEKAEREAKEQAEREAADAAAKALAEQGGAGGASDSQDATQP
ncbi:hypothetical protein [Simplicispira sedimenti]|uniref:hypothetical protein n=1 Tax=Simplicispira sedimenti TaxID=2919500 RepID=UPI001FAA3551|nr:hypothetical protein [Acidovorax sp. W1-6]